MFCETSPVTRFLYFHGALLRTSGETGGEDEIRKVTRASNLALLLWKYQNFRDLSVLSRSGMQLDHLMGSAK